MKTLYVMIGTPGSGKSTWINSVVPTATVISPDAYLTDKYNYDWSPVRAAEAWAASYQSLGRAIVNEMFMEPDAEYVWDSVNATPRDRGAVLNFAKGAGWHVVAVYFDTPFEECVRRNALREKFRRVPDKTMADIQFRMTPPDDVEGFSDSIYVSWDGK